MYKVFHALSVLAFAALGLLILFDVFTPSLQTTGVIAYWSMALCNYSLLMIAKKD